MPGPLSEPSVAADPGEEALDHLSARMHGEAALPAWLAHDPNGNNRGCRRPATHIAGDSRHRGDEWKDPARQAQHLHDSVPTPEVRQLRVEAERARPCSVNSTAPPQSTRPDERTRPTTPGSIDALRLELGGASRVQMLEGRKTKAAPGADWQHTTSEQTTGRRRARATSNMPGSVHHDAPRPRDRSL